MKIVSAKDNVGSVLGQAPHFVCISELRST